MTFGTIKSIIENNLLESYKNEKEFKKTLREFKHNVLNNKSMSKAYTLYDQLSTPQGLNDDFKWAMSVVCSRSNCMFA